MKSKLLILGAVAVLLLTGCETVQFYSQSVAGHTRLMLARQPLSKAINQAQPPERTLLESIPAVLDFAELNIGLAAKGSYSSFVPLQRDYPVYTVMAAQEFSTTPENWCYLVIGCASYRGYFSEMAAKQFASKLVEQNLEVHVQGATAYSTLGWFDDPVLPTMLRYGQVALVELLLHELTHQR